MGWKSILACTYVRIYLGRNQETRMSKCYKQTIESPTRIGSIIRVGERPMIDLEARAMSTSIFAHTLTESE